MVKGVVTFYGPERGYGYVLSDSGAEVSVTANDIVTGTGKDPGLWSDRPVEFDIVSDRRGSRAVNVEAVDASE